MAIRRKRRKGKPLPFQNLLTMRSALILFLLMMAVALVESMAPQMALAHPADELCELDPVLCRQLEALDRATPVSSLPIPPRSLWGTVELYVWLGITHIIPKGLDHILFVLALFLAARNARSLLIQISAFTVAHTVTLALAATRTFELPGSIVEPLIALSIAWVAVENLFFRDAQRWRPLIVFGFGLLHGFGFAGVLAELGLEPGQFAASLISFNVGVELGQLAVIALALAVTLPLRFALSLADHPRLYDRAITIPASLLIGAIGLYWFVERIGGNFLS
jgi:hypothetical protein